MMIRRTFSVEHCLVRLATLALVATGCRSAPEAKAASQQPHDSHCPNHWWMPIPKAGAPKWEILPQEDKPGEVVLSKRNEPGLLSNFAPTPFTFHGQRYASLEGYGQMMKYPESAGDPRATFPGVNWDYTREQVAQLTRFAAKRPAISRNRS
jgi:hypothetical protein